MGCMNTEHLEKKFAAIGARTKVRTVKEGRWGWRPGSVAPGAPKIDILQDRKGEYFDIAVAEGDENLELQVLDVQPKDRHLLLMVRPEDGEKSKVLCGHDEMHSFAAPVPTATIHVRDAMERLKPGAIQEVSKRAKKKNRNRRKNEAFIRQGEWFFVPRPNFEPPKNAHVGRNEPLQRDGGSKPHICEELYQARGETTMIHREHAPQGLDIRKYNKLDRDVRQAGGWRRQSRVTTAFVRGKVRHPDHHTITLRGWHEVMLNREGAVRSSVVAFLD
jgi:hypothetical protein